MTYNREDTYSLNKMKFYLDNSEYEDNFMIMNVDFNYYYKSNFSEHFSRWFNDGNDDYIVMVNTELKVHQLIKVGIAKDKILLRKDYTKMKKQYDNNKKWVYDYLHDGKLILYDISDVRLFEQQKFYFGVSKNDTSDRITRPIRYGTGHVVKQEFDRLVYISNELKGRYYAERMRLSNIDKILNA